MISRTIFVLQQINRGMGRGGNFIELAVFKYEYIC